MIPVLDSDEYYDLLDLEGRNCIGAYTTEVEALAAVREEIALNGRESVLTLGLGHRHKDGEYSKVAEGAELLARAEAAATTGVPGTVSDT
jgi:hypothetical protein